MTREYDNNCVHTAIADALASRPDVIDFVWQRETIGTREVLWVTLVVSDDHISYVACDDIEAGLKVALATEFDNVHVLPRTEASQADVERRRW